MPGKRRDQAGRSSDGSGRPGGGAESPLISGIGQAGVASLEYALGFGMGMALGRVLAPEGARLAQTAWSVDPTKAMEPGTAATVVAEEIHDQQWGRDHAKKHGLDHEPFDALVEEIKTAPGVGELLRMLRRGTIDPAGFQHGLRKAKVERRWDSASEDLQHERLDPAAVATAIQRGIIHDPGFLPTPIDFRGSNVPYGAEVPIDALREARDEGESAERLKVRTRIVGLPPAPGELLQLVNRRVINEAAFRLGIAEGNTRNEWSPFLLHLRRRLLTPHEWAELHLRGWVDEAAMLAGARMEGLEDADTRHLFEVLGRPIPVHQVTTGEARGGSYNGPIGQIPAAFLASVRQSNIRPEWYNLAYANRYTYPSTFVLRSLVQSHDLTEAEGHRILLEIGWKPDLARKVAQRWAAGTGGRAATHTARAEAQLWTTLHTSYVDGDADQAHATALLRELGVPAVEVAPILRLWNAERGIVRRRLTPSQIKKAERETKITHEDALARLERLGMAPADAELFLAE